MRHIIKTFFVFSIVFLFSFIMVSPIHAQDDPYGVTNNDAPNTQAVVDQALANGETPDQAAADAVTYLKSAQAGGWDATIIHNDDGSITVQCANGASVTIPAPQPTPETQPPAEENTPPAQQNTPAVPQCGECTYQQNCTTPQGTQGKQNCNGTLNNGVCGGNSAACGGLSCGACVGPGTPANTPPPAQNTPPTQNTPPAQNTPPVQNTPPPPVCGSACSQSADCSRASNGCNVCTNGKCAAPTPTPTPYVPVCSCNGIDSDPIFPGSTVKVTANAKVTGNDVGKSTVTSITFVLYKGDNTTGQIITKATQPVTQTSASASEVDYQATWEVKIPSDVDPNVVYRITTDQECGLASGANVSSLHIETVNQSAQTSPQPRQSLLESILSFIKSLFGISSPQNNSQKTVATPTPMENASAAPASYLSTNSASLAGTNGTPTQKQSLQLRAIYPAQVLEKACKIMRFQFDQ